MSKLFEQLQKAADFKAQAQLASAIAADEAICAAARSAAESEGLAPEPEPEILAVLDAPPAPERSSVSAALKAMSLALVLALAALAWYHAPSRDAPDSASPKQPPASKIDRDLKTGVRYEIPKR